ncbi:MAG: polysaccharide biosynthesis/export family protein [Gemmataceae bacterium]|nr:polysaccharide biosynthesis/export family protein [Gemmataceae bacterium]MCI0740950.1 polysaccharide biosynthesis/export family protein [Gemmataceae bacterium]
MTTTRRKAFGALVITLLTLSASGCLHTHRQHKYAPIAAPNESMKVTQPTYMIEPPDVLLIDAANLIPRPPYKIGALDVLAIQVTHGDKKVPLIEGEPIAALFAVSPEGKVDLGFTYGSVQVVGMTLDQAKSAVEKHLLLRFKGPLNVSVDLAQSNQALQQIRGEHLVRPDGTVGLGTYGSVYVDGMTLEQAKSVIENHLAQFLLNPKISLDVAGFNSKVYYVITDGAGAGQQVYRLPITGKETVLDAIAQVNGLTPVSSKDHIWVARPALAHEEPEMKMAVDWNGITQKGRTATNYQLMPGDRVYVMGAPLVTLDTYVARVLSPFERVLGIILLGKSAFDPNFNQGF